MSERLSETETHFFDNMSQQEVTLIVMNDILGVVRQLAGKPSMSQDEAFRFVIATGLAYIDGEQALRATSESDCAQELARVSKQMTDYYAQYAVMKFKAFSLLKVARILELNVAGLRPMEQGLRGVVERLRDENKQLKAEIEALRQRGNAA
jgi:cell division septum initiation protein DivIVA